MHKSDKELVESLYFNKDASEHNKEVVDILTRQIKSFHDFYQPEVIILTETSAVPNGYVIKEASQAVHFVDQNIIRTFQRVEKAAEKSLELTKKIDRTLDLVLLVSVLIVLYIGLRIKSEKLLS